MSPDLSGVLRLTGGSVLAAGALAAGAAIGAAAERAIIARSARPDPNWHLTEFSPEVHELILDDGTWLHVEIDDPGNAPLTVIFSHGYALSASSFAFQRRALQGRARLVFYDQRSHGRSARAEIESHHVDQLGHDLMAVIDTFAPTGPLMLVGHSMGGMTIMALAEQFPELFGDRIRGVALISTAAGGITEVSLGLPPIARQAFHKFAPRVAMALARRKDVVEFGRRSSSDLSLILTRLFSFGSRASDEAGEFVASMIEATPIDVLAEFLPALQEHDKFDALPVLQAVEVLVIVGDADRLTPKEHSEAIVRHIPGAEFVVIRNGGHMANIEFHEQVDQALLQLLARVERNLRGAA